MVTCSDADTSDAATAMMDDNVAAAREPGMVALALQQYHLDPQQHPKTMFASCPLPFPNANAAASANNPAAPMLVLLEKATGSLLNIYQGHDHGQYPLQSCLTHTDAQVVSGCESGAVSKLPPEE